MPIVLRNTGDPLPAYFSLSVGYHFGSGLGGWVERVDQALQFGRKEDARAFADKFLPQLAPWCEPVERNENPAT